MKNNIQIMWLGRLITVKAFLIVMAIFLITTKLSAQTNPSLEFASGGASATATGPTVANQVITFQRNTNNPTGNTFTTQTPAKTVTFSLTNQQTTSISSPGVGVMFGGGNSATTAGAAAYAIYAPLNNLGAANDTHFRSLGGTATAGSEGISASSNYGVVVYTSTRPFYESNAPLPASGSSVIYQMADLVLTFNSPVSNPILHFSGLGGLVQNGPSTPISSELVMLSPGLTLTRLSGSPEFSVPSATEIRNSAPSFFPTTGSGGASGSVQVNGTNITSITFRVYLKAQGQGTIAWSASSTDNRGDGFLVSVSLGESDLAVTKTVNNSNPTVGSSVTFTVVATNNGVSNKIFRS